MHLKFDAISEALSLARGFRNVFQIEDYRKTISKTSNRPIYLAQCSLCFFIFHDVIHLFLLITTRVDNLDNLVIYKFKSLYSLTVVCGMLTFHY